MFHFSGILDDKKRSNFCFWGEFRKFFMYISAQNPSIRHIQPLKTRIYWVLREILATDCAKVRCRLLATATATGRFSSSSRYWLLATSSYLTILVATVLGPVVA